MTDNADDVVEIDMTDPGTLSPAFEGIDRACLLMPFVPDQTPLVENLVDAAVAADVDHLVRHSAMRRRGNLNSQSVREVPPITESLVVGLLERYFPTSVL